MRKLLLYAPPDDQVPVGRVRGVTPAKAKILAESRFGITTVQGLLQHYPRRHLDFSETKTIRELRVGDEVTIFGEVRRVQLPPPRQKKFPLRVSVHDGTSVFALVFFNQPWRAKQLRPGTFIAAKGKVSMFKGTRQMTSPLVDVIKDPEDAVKIVPVYPATAEIQTSFLRRIVRAALEDFSPLADPLPAEMRLRHGLPARTDAMRGYHFPEDAGELERARQRLVFDELFTLQVGLAYRKSRLAIQTVGITHKIESDLASKFRELLPFDFTQAQVKATEEITSDMARSSPMNRLLQGEVGSGKTVVALHAALLAVQGGYQVAFMAPTEVLAAQHFLTLSTLLEPLTGGTTMTGQLDLFGGPGVVLLTGSLSAERRRAALHRIADGSAGIAIGTHALIQEGISIPNLGLAIVDEQHRFGVHQRFALKERGRGGETPDVLIMTATPIPRTLALTLYGDLDVSVLDELPKGRMPVATRVIAETERESAYQMVRDEVAAGHQAFVIVPLIDESDRLDVRSAEQESERLATQLFPDLRVGKVHGRLHSRDKESVMDRFRAGEIDVLISTTVLEVGIDVPNASIMLIEDADRFGLSQLHQLRGRIGRGTAPSICLVFSSAAEGDEASPARRRLEAFASTNDGFEIASLDLELRGAGTILGERQAGFSDLKITDLLRDIDILTKAREEAFAMVDSDPELSQHPLIRSEMEGRFFDRLEWLFRS